MTAECKHCKKPFQRIRTGAYNSKTPKFLDEFGRAWSGRLCHTCNKLRLRLHMRIRRAHEA